MTQVNDFIRLGRQHHHQEFKAAPPRRVRRWLGLSHGFLLVCSSFWGCSAWPRSPPLHAARHCGRSPFASAPPARRSEPPAAAWRARWTCRGRQAPELPCRRILPLAFTLNGAARSLDVAPETTLAEALRGALGLTGTKIACNRGACSACTVWLDGEPVCACMVLARCRRAQRHDNRRTRRRQDATADTARIHRPRRHSVRLLHARPRYELRRTAQGDAASDADQVRRRSRDTLPLRHVSPRHRGNVGRRRRPDDGTTARAAPRLSRAASRARGWRNRAPHSRRRAAAAGAERRPRVIGQRVPRIDARAKVTGAARFTVDVNCRECCMRASYARRCRMRAFARSTLSGRASRRPRRHDRASSRRSGRRRALLRAPVAALAATARVAEAALGLIQVDYETLPFVVDFEEAREAYAPRVYDGASARCRRVGLSLPPSFRATETCSRPSTGNRGDVEGGLPKPT